MKRLSALCLVSALSACATQAPPVGATVTPIGNSAPIKVKPPVAVPAQPASTPSVPDARCVSIAKYARAISNLKSVGVSLDDIGSFSSSPVALEIPMKALQYNVYVSGLSAEDTQTKVQEQCELLGYQPFVNSLTGQERARIKMFQLDVNPDPLKVTPKK